MDHTPRITAEADIGERDDSIVLDDFRLQANNIFPGSIEEIKIIQKKLVLSMRRPATMLDDGHRERCHSQVQDLFRNAGLHDVVIEETGGENRPQIPINPTFSIPTAPDGLTTQTTA